MTQLPYAEISVAQKRLERKIAELHKKTYLPQELVLLMAEVSRIQLAAEAMITFGSERDTDTALEMKLPVKPDAGAGEQEEAPSQESPQRTAPVLPEALPIAEASRHAQGVPVLSREHFPLDYASLPVIAQNIFAVLGDISDNLRQYGESLQDMFDKGLVSLEEACRSIVAEPVSLDEKSYFQDWAKNNPGAPYFFSFIAASCVLPSVKVAAELLAVHHDDEKVWPHGHCPICGSLPLMGRLVKTEGFRMHTCSFCLHEFKATRMACPFCLNVGEEKETYFVSDEEPGYQLHICHECNNYCKIADFREFDRQYLPVLDDLGSLVLDIYARKQGFLRPTLSVWGV